MTNFWKELKTPIIGLSPMDGVTDAAYRLMVTQTSSPSLTMTEFVNVEGLTRGATKMLDDFIYSPSEKPVVAQIYGIELDSFYKVALMACFLGFDGIDINMGCPAKKVSERGAGSGLIRTPDHAKEIIRIVKKAVEDFSNGITMEQAQIRPKVIFAVEKMMPKDLERKKIPVSVKTRIGYKEIEVESWIKNIVEENPDAITLHGRTLKQMYTGEACWDSIATAAQIVKSYNPEIIFLGNGDVKTLEDAHQRSKEYGTDGVLVGRATYGNPWFFDGDEPTQEDRIAAAIKHSEIFEEVLSHRQFFIMRKHLGWYMKGFDGAREKRSLLMRASSAQEVKEILSS